MSKKVHFIGIGGIGVSSLAQYYLTQGWWVSGSDAARSEITDDLKKKGVKIYIGQKASNIKLPDLVIYSAAIKSDNLEFFQAKTKGYPLLSYAQAIGELTKKYFTIAVAGSHGKSTTTAIIGLILVEAGLDPTIIIGTKLKGLGNTNFRMGQSQYLVLEADEYAKSFHNYFPKIAVLTNIDKEHLDIYKNLAGVLAGFRKFFGNISKNGHLVANTEDDNIKKIVMTSSVPNIKVTWYKKGHHPLLIPGIHNQFNAEAAWQTVKLLGVKKSVADKVFKSYTGAWRRMELLVTSNKQQETSKNKKHVPYPMSHVTIYSDYAHHPTEIRATLQALKEKYPKKKIICVFQPHQQDRLNRLFKEFLTAFNTADKTILYPLYKVKGRHPSTSLGASTVGKSSADLVKAINKSNVVYADNFKKVLFLLRSDLSVEDVIVFMSAGDLDANARNYFCGK